MRRFALAATSLSLLLAGCISNPFQREPSHPAAKTPPTNASPTAGSPTVAPPTATPPTEAPSRVRVAEAPSRRRAMKHLAEGVKAYDNGDYKTARKELQDALDQGLAGKVAKAKAHKYLAFMACAEGELTLCKSHFRRAFALNPSFRLTKAEAGHPVWGPVFKETKAEARRKPGVAK